MKFICVLDKIICYSMSIILIPGFGIKLPNKTYIKINEFFKHSYTFRNNNYDTKYKLVGIDKNTIRIQQFAANQLYSPQNVNLNFFENPKSIMHIATPSYISSTPGYSSGGRTKRNLLRKRKSRRN